jgi:hypothetical protein
MVTVRRRRYYVYIYKRPWSERICYVGKGRGKRWLRHEELGVNHPNPFFAKLFVKAAGQSFIKEKVAEHLTEQEAFTLEKELIQKYGRFPNGPLVNLTDGGEGSSGFTMSRSTRKKISEANKGKVIPPATRLKISEALKGRPSPNKGRIASEETRQKQSIARRGSRRSEESRRKMSEAQRLIQKPTGWHHSEETKQKIREALSLVIQPKGWRHSEATKQKMRDTYRLRHQQMKEINS